MLTKANEVFCQEYVSNFGNGAAAYRVAYPDNKSPKDGAYQLLKKDEVKARVAQLQQEAYSAASITPEKIGLKLNELAFGEKVSPNVQLKALDLLQKQFGLQQQKIQAEVNNDIVISID